MLLANWFRCLVGKQGFKRPQAFNGLNIGSWNIRNLADTPDASSKQIMLRGTESEARLRVRRARPGDAPRVLRFVREHARTTWPGLAAPPAASHLVLCDYVARGLAQGFSLLPGHSMVAELTEPRRGATHIRGVALGFALCPWDAHVLEHWARCVQCTRSRRLVAFTAHCLRAPALHHKYQVHSVLQIILIVPRDSSKNSEIINLLAKNAIKRGQEVGFPLIRFDVACENMAKALEELELKKEWQLSYDVLPDGAKTNELSNELIMEKEKDNTTPDDNPKPNYQHHIAVYTTLLSANKK